MPDVPDRGAVSGIHPIVLKFCDLDVLCVAY
jgi:hypothetical protein